MTIDELFDMIDEDFNIRPNNINEKSYKVANYHAKYLRLYFKYKKMYLEEERKLNFIYTERYHFYNGASDTCYEFTLDKKEVQFHILSDEDYSKQSLKVESLKLLVDCLDRTVKRCQYLTNDVKNCIELLKYENGV